MSPSAPASTSSPPTRSGTAAQEAGLDDATSQAIADNYEEAQLQSLKAGLLAAAFLAFVSLAFTRDLPHGETASGASRDEETSVDGKDDDNVDA